jgi:hypothetical protein
MGYLVREYADQSKRGMGLCLQNRLVVPAMTLFYAAIDVLGFLVSTTPYAEKRSFTSWADKYLDAILKKKGLAGTDLYSARCGVLHTGQAPSEMVDLGAARELWYRFGGESHVNMMTNTPKPAVLIDVEELVESFNEGVERFIADVDANPTLQTRAKTKAEKFFRRGLLVGPV